MRRVPFGLVVVLLLAGVPVVATAQTPTCRGAPATATGQFVTGTDANDVIVGTEGADALHGGGGNDLICSGEGDDTITLGTGDDYLDAGGGVDTLAFSFPVQAVTVDLQSGTASDSMGSDEIELGTVENLVSDCNVQSDDIFIGDGDANKIIGGPGNDRLVGNGGNDLIYGTDPVVDRTDAICWAPAYDRDDDNISGGDGDDVLLGQLGNDALDGDADWDVLDGYSGIDDCRNGERYARCEVENPPPPPPECSNGADDDGGGVIDHPADVECSSAQDPTEDPAADPRCNDGLDNDGDGAIDFPEDFDGCESLDDDTEFLYCRHPCLDALTINLGEGRGVFKGRLFASEPCLVDRRIRLKKVRPGSDRRLGMDLTGADGRWGIPGSPAAHGRFYAVAARKSETLSGGEPVDCFREFSPILRIHRD